MEDVIKYSVIGAMLIYAIIGYIKFFRKRSMIPKEERIPFFPGGLKNDLYYMIFFWKDEYSLENIRKKNPDWSEEDVLEVYHICHQK
jgi:hypothetical protein